MSELETLFRRERILSMASVKDVLGTNSRMTAFRHLKALAYRSSYSHRGMYYTLPDIPNFDRWGLWSFDCVYFSAHGTLLSTIQGLVEKAAGGCTAMELEELLHVRAQNAVKQLVDQGSLLRRQIGSEYVYLHPGKSALQSAARKGTLAETLERQMPSTWRGAPQTIDEHMRSFLAALNEKQRRLYLGFESLKIGHGGDVAIASLAGVNVKTVARGRQELVAKDVSLERVRAKGAGRPPLKKTS